MRRRGQQLAGAHAHFGGEMSAHLTRGAARRWPVTGSPPRLAETGEASTSVEEQTVARGEAK
jgi:hypothetical protein